MIYDGSVFPYKVHLPKSGHITSDYTDSSNTSSVFVPIPVSQSTREFQLDISLYTTSTSNSATSVAHVSTSSTPVNTRHLQGQQMSNSSGHEFETLRFSSPTLSSSTDTPHLRHVLDLAQLQVILPIAQSSISHVDIYNVPSTRSSSIQTRLKTGVIQRQNYVAYLSS